MENLGSNVAFRNLLKGNHVKKLIMFPHAVKLLHPPGVGLLQQGNNIHFLLENETKETVVFSLSVISKIPNFFLKPSAFCAGRARCA